MNIYRRSGLLLSNLIHIWVFITFLLAARPAQAQAPERTEAFVYGTTYYNGYIYGNAFIPAQVDTIHLIAGAPSIIAPRITQVYYWAITNRYLADWNQMNVLVQGKLEILRDGSLVVESELVPYVVQYDTNAPMETLGLYTGEEAQAASRRFQERQQQYRDALFAHSEAQQAYRELVTELMRQHQDNPMPEEDFPPAPKAPPPFSLYSTNLAYGFEVNLQEGSYVLRLRTPDGEIQPGSQKKLVIFSKLNEGVSYKIYPETRWTQPEETSRSNSVVYTPVGATLYLQPFRQVQFNEYAYRKMEDPQDTQARRDRQTWVPFEPLKNVSLLTAQPGGQDNRLPLQPYFVQQLPGASLGYEIVPYDPASMDHISFDAFKLTMDSRNLQYTIQLTNEEGSIIQGGERQVRVLYTQRSLVLYVVSALPLLIGAVLIVNRKSRIKKIKAEE
jgi:hypothetical protein